MVDFKALSTSVFEEQNNVRMNPSSLIPHLENTLKYFKGNVLYLPGAKCGLSTNEGPAAYKEAIEFLKKVSPISAFTWVDEMARAASDHANDIGPKNIVGHSGSDGSSMQSRLERYGEWDITIGENIDFGGKTGKDVISNLIVDDGVQSRGHRKNIFNTTFTVCGIGAQAHGSYGTCIVLDYAGGYSKKGDSSKVNSNSNSNFAFKNNAEQGFHDKATPIDLMGKKFEDFNIHEFKPSKNEGGGIDRQVYTIKSTGNQNIDDPFINDFLAKNNINKFGHDGLGKQVYNIKTTGNSNSKDPFNEDIFGKNNLKNNQEEEGKPEGTIQTRVARNITITNGKRVILEKKTYTLKDGSTKIIETKIEE